jgi:hypothetical protein
MRSKGTPVILVCACTLVPVRGAEGSRHQALLGKQSGGLGSLWEKLREFVRRNLNHQERRRRDHGRALCRDALNAMIYGVFVGSQARQDQAQRDLAIAGIQSMIKVIRR